MFTVETHRKHIGALGISPLALGLECANNMVSQPESREQEWFISTMYRDTKRARGLNGGRSM